MSSLKLELVSSLSPGISDHSPPPVALQYLSEALVDKLKDYLSRIGWRMKLLTIIEMGLPF
jgi:hypothetical protein